MFNTSKKLKKTLSIFLILVIASCAGKEKGEEEENLLKKKRFNPNVRERALNEKGGGLFFNKDKSGSGTFEFATSNPLWRASLEVLEFMPLQALSYSGGLISTDWYSKGSVDESIKVAVRFNSKELAISSLTVVSYKKICTNGLNCKIVDGSEKFNSTIKSQIIEKARAIKLSEEKKKK